MAVEFQSESGMWSIWQSDQLEQGDSLTTLDKCGDALVMTHSLNLRVFATDRLDHDRMEMTVMVNPSRTSNWYLSEVQVHSLD